MKILKPSTEHEMVSKFLKMELDSKRFGDEIKTVLSDLNIKSEIITNGNLFSEDENNLRAVILNRTRGYKHEVIFENYPTFINWYWAVFNKDDLNKILYIEYSYWNELSNYTGSPLEAAKTILSGRTVYDVPNDSAVESALMLRNGYTFPPMIFLTDTDESRYIILEGHGRMTAYGLVPELFNNVSVLLGYCKHEELNKWYGVMPPRPLVEGDASQ
jgi:hypothetical protein